MRRSRRRRRGGARDTDGAQPAAGGAGRGDRAERTDGGSPAGLNGEGAPDQVWTEPAAPASPGVRVLPGERLRLASNSPDLPASADPAGDTPGAAEGRAAAVDAERRRESGGGSASSPDQRSGSGGCTLSQLRRFVKSRPYVPMHELRRRFSLNGYEDDVFPIASHGIRLYVGLPEREAHLLEELLQQGEVGYECSLDPPSPIIVGVYPMRPVPRA